MNPNTVIKPSPRAVLLLSSLLIGAPWLTQAQVADSATQSKAGHQHSYASTNNSNSSKQVKTYTCPMHPEVESHEPGRCPQCNMFLVENEHSAASHSHGENAANAATYICPMHPEVVSHEPGRCPQCNMFLVENEHSAASHSHGENAANAATYICPMHPEVVSHEPGRCPKCNMFLVEKAEEAATAAATQTHAAHQPHAPAQVFETPPKASNLVNNQSEQSIIKYICPMHAHIISDVPSTCPICGMNLEKVEIGGNGQEISIHVSGSMQQALALKVAKVERDTLWKHVETVGQIDYDESQISHIHARVSGWVEKLMVKSMGDTVKKGQLLYEIYSPDLINAQDDYLLALDTAKTAGNPKYQDLVRRAGLRLSFLGFTEQQIKQLASSHQTQYRVPFYAQQAGVVETLSIRDGMYIEPSTEIMSLVDLSKLWVIADVFENEQSWISVGQKAEVAVPAMNISSIEGKIDYIYPELDPVTRSLRVRIVLNNKDISLRPKTLAKVALFGGPNRDVLVIPQEALIQTGKKNRVIVKQADDSFIAKEVTVGMMSQGKAEIVSGLGEDERVVISGQFLLDSESSLKGSLMRLSSGHQH